MLWNRRGFLNPALKGLNCRHRPTGLKIKDQSKHLAHHCPVHPVFPLSLGSNPLSPVPSPKQVEGTAVQGVEAIPGLLPIAGDGEG